MLLTREDCLNNSYSNRGRSRLRLRGTYCSRRILRRRGDLPSYIDRS